MKNVPSKFRLSYLALVVILFSLVTSSFAQDKVIGQIYSKAEADQLFGPVLKSVTIPVADLSKTLDKCNSYVMFALDVTDSQPQLIATDENRKPVNGYSKQIKADKVLNKYSKSKVVELLSKSGITSSSSLSTSATVTLEVRSNVFSVSTGVYTLEMAILCPPYCL